MRTSLIILIVAAFLALASCSSQVRNGEIQQADNPPQSENSQQSSDQQQDYQVADNPAQDSDQEAITSEIASEPEPTGLTDEEVIYKFSVAEEYYAFGVAANLRKDWNEAQYYFEKAIEELTTLEFDFDSTDSENVILEHSYRRLMNEITSDYKLTLFNLNILDEEASPFALDEKFRQLDSLSGFAGDTIVTREVIAQQVTYDMPITINDKVTKWIIYFQTSARKNMELWLARSGMYIPLMEKILEEEGVPHDLVYLPIIESGFSSRAYSRVAAVGFWQFMSYTARQWGLKIDWWYDERRDFEKATRAAAKYLKYLYGEFNDWRLALTAYNGGPGNVNKMIRYNKGKDYWDWRIRNREMGNFVSKYMAATIIAKEPLKYGFDVEYGQPLKWEVVTIDRAVYLKDIANATGVSVKKIKELNPAILRDYTPPNMKKFKLRLPVGTSSRFFADFGKMESPEETSFVRHRISRGETVSTIARRYGVSQQAIIQFNNLRRPYRIIAGKTIVIPVPIGGSYASSSGSYELTGNHYIVRRGDNLSKIARAFRTTPEAIAQLNNLHSKHQISVGQKLNIPGKSTSQPYTGQYFSYRIRRGDTLSKLAHRYGTSVGKICSFNGISRWTTLYIGQELKIPGSAPSSTYASTGLSGSASSSGDYFIHTVTRGQNLTYLAKKYNTSVNAICGMNGISKWSTLSIGQKLKIPGKYTVADVPSHTGSKAEYVNHRVRSGETLSLIAGKYRTSVNDICTTNGISKHSTIYVGQVLRVPLGGGAVTNNDYVIYVVRRGDTLWDIARTFDTSTHEIIRLNNHVNPRNLRVGDKLKIRVN